MKKNKQKPKAKLMYKMSDDIVIKYEKRAAKEKENKNEAY